MSLRGALFATRQSRSADFIKAEIAGFALSREARLLRSARKDGLKTVSVISHSIMRSYRRRGVVVPEAFDDLQPVDPVFIELFGIPVLDGIFEDVQVLVGPSHPTVRSSRPGARRPAPQTVR